MGLPTWCLQIFYFIFLKCNQALVLAVSRNQFSQGDQRYPPGWMPRSILSLGWAESTCSTSNGTPLPLPRQIFLFQDTIFSWFCPTSQASSPQAPSLILIPNLLILAYARAQSSFLFLYCSRLISWGTLQSQGFRTTDMLTCPMWIFLVQIFLSLSLSPSLPCLLKIPIYRCNYLLNIFSWLPK